MSLIGWRERGIKSTITTRRPSIIPSIHSHHHRFSSPDYRSLSFSSINNRRFISSSSFRSSSFRSPSFLTSFHNNFFVDSSPPSLTISSHHHSLFRRFSQQFSSTISPQHRNKNNADKSTGSGSTTGNNKQSGNDKKGSEESSNKSKEKSTMKSSTKYLIGSLVSLGTIGSSIAGYYYYINRFGKKKKTINDEAWETSPERIIDEPTTQYIHPFSNRPWYWQYYFLIWRISFLLYHFVPVYFIWMWYELFHSNDIEWRQYALNKVLKAIERSGCSMQKLAQWASMRPDVFPIDLCEQLGKLRDKAPQHSFEWTRSLVEREFGLPLEELFDSFDLSPVASGSVAQVYSAILNPKYALPGTPIDQPCKVAVKVRHPSVELESYRDLELLFNFVNTFLSKYFVAPCSYDDLLHILRQQLDFRWEAYNLYKLADNFKDDPCSERIAFPKVSRRLHSESVLVESWVEGQSIASLFAENFVTAVAQPAPKKDELPVPGVDPSKVKDFIVTAKATVTHQDANQLKTEGEIEDLKNNLATNIFDLTIKMFLRDNFIHGDLHAGNLLYDRKHDIVTIIDAGLVTSLRPQNSVDFGEFLKAMCKIDAKNTAKYLKNLNRSGKLVDDTALENTVDIIYQRYQQMLKEGRGNLGDAMGQVLLHVRDHGIILDGDVAASLATISIVEGLILQLAPKYDLVKHALPYFMVYRGFASEMDILTTLTPPLPPLPNLPDLPKIPQLTTITTTTTTTTTKETTR